MMILRTAIRDSRKNRLKVTLFMLAIVLGVAAIVAINSFNKNLEFQINTEAKSLLGADLAVSSNKGWNEEALNIFDSIPGIQSTERKLFSMAYVPSLKQSKFVNIRAITGDFPYYGSLDTKPKNASIQYKHDIFALVDDGMMLQMGLSIGDTIQLGDLLLPIGGRLMTAFGSIQAGTSFAPPIYIKGELLDQSNLIQTGSFVDYNIYFKVNREFDVEKWHTSHAKTLRNLSIESNTVESQKMNLRDAFSSFNTFLNLVALISLLLACIGVLSSVFVYIKSKEQSIAVLRCLGMKSYEAMLVYILQIFFIGLISVGIGIVLGSAVQFLIPKILSSFIPFDVESKISLSAILMGGWAGMCMTILFSLIPLIGIRNISPLSTLRVNNEKKKKDALRIIVYIAILLFLFGYLYFITSSVYETTIGLMSLLAIFSFLSGVSWAVIWAARKFSLLKFPYIFRQGISNLYRPNNQTNTLILSIGLGTAILSILLIMQGLILQNVSNMGSGNQPNMILFGIETNQKKSLEKIASANNMPIIQHVPVVTMELVSWKGKSKKQWLKDSTRTASVWAINREARVSYQGHMNKDEKLIAGKFRGLVNHGDSIFISLAQRYADALDVSLGDQMTWNVQGALIDTYVGSIREINFRKMESRFFILFPEGVLEQAPQFYILVTKSPDKTTSATFQNEVVRLMPNVSIVDLESILKTLSSLLSKLSFVIKFMASFSILIGIIILISSLLLSKYTRIRESVLLRTLGAMRSHIFKIAIVEYVSLGILAALTGIFIGIACCYLLAKYVFELQFMLSILPILTLFVTIVFITLLIGLLNSRDVVRSSPLEVLRKQ